MTPVAKEKLHACWAVARAGFWSHFLLLIALAIADAIFNSEQGQSLIDLTRLNGDYSASFYWATLFSILLVCVTSTIVQMVSFKLLLKACRAGTDRALLGKISGLVPAAVLAIWLVVLVRAFHGLPYFWLFASVVGLLVFAYAFSLMRSGKYSQRLVAGLAGVMRARGGAVNLLLLLLCLLPALLGAYVSVSNVDLLEPLGPVGVILIGITSVACLFTCIFVVFPAFLGSFRYALVPLCLAFAFRLIAEPHFVGADALPGKGEYEQSRAGVDRMAPPEPSILTAAGLKFKNYQEFSAKPDRPPESWLISAEGGGIRSAYWTGMVLANLNEQTDGELGKRAVMYSGVSGGSLGVATWLAADALSSLTPLQKTETVHAFLSRDFFSPLVAGLLFLDLPKIVLGPLWWKDSRDVIFERAIIRRWKRQTGSNFFARKLIRDGLCDAPCNQPVVVFNTTEVTSGLLVPISNGSGWLAGWNSPTRRIDHPMERDLKTTTLLDAPIATLVHLSARFPFLSPTGIIGFRTDTLWEKRREEAKYLNDDLSQPIEVTQALVREAEAKYSPEAQAKLPGITLAGRLVDGGYIDNSGLLMVLEALIPLRAQLQDYALSKYSENPQYDWFKYHEIRLIHIGNNPGAGAPPAISASKVSPPTLDWFTGPIETLLSAREGRTLQTKSSLVREREDTRTNVRVYMLELANVLGALDEFSYSQSKTDATKANLKGELANRRQHMRNLFQMGVIGESELRAKLAQKEIYYTKLVSHAEKMRCKQGLRDASKKNPPLGWMLGPHDIRLLHCLAAEAAKVSGPPWPQDP